MGPEGRRARPVEGVDVRLGPVEDDAPVRLDDDRKISVPLGLMEAVPEHEHVVDLDARHTGRERDDAPYGPVEQRADLEGPGRALPNVRQEVREREAGVDDVLDEDDVAPARCRRRGPSGSVPDPSPARSAEMARKSTVTSMSVMARTRSARKSSAALQHADEHDAVGVVVGDLTGDALDVRADACSSARMVGARFFPGLRRLGHSPSESRTASTSNAARSARPNRVSEPAPVAPWRAPAGCAA